MALSLSLSLDLNLDYIRNQTSHLKKIKECPNKSPNALRTTPKQRSPMQLPSNRSATCSTASRSNCWTVKFYRRRCWRNTSVPVSWRKNHHSFQPKKAVTHCHCPLKLTHLYSKTTHPNQIHP
jgi:hypothetical protein